LIVPIAIKTRRVAYGALALVVFIAVLVPWTVRNEHRFNTLVPVSNNLGTVLDGANCDLTYGGPYLGSWRSQFANGRSAAGFQCFQGFDIKDPRFDEATAAARSRRRGVDYATGHKKRWPVVAVARLGRTWGVFRPSQQVNLGVLEGRDHRFERLGTTLHWLLLPFAIAGAILLIRKRSVVWPVLAPIVTVSIVSVLTYGNQRFRITADPMLAVLAAVAIASLLPLFGATRRGRSGPSLAAPRDTRSATLG
jgi:uncharacterized membrane protein YjgN (DUF898 family)